VNEHAALDRIYKRALDFRPVKAEDHDFNTFPGFANAFNNPFNAVPRLDDEFQLFPPEIRCGATAASLDEKST
jgi:hypothetical protein